MNSFITRVISGALFITLITLSIFLGTLYFYILFFIINIICIFEFNNMAKIAHLKINMPTTLLSSSILLTSAYWHSEGGSINGYAIALAATFITSIFELYRHRNHSFQNLALSIYVMFYITMPFALLFYFPSLRTELHRVELVFLPFVYIWINDSFAYIFGSKLGKHKLFPAISPKKSWEGCIGGIVTTVLFAALLVPQITNIKLLDIIFIALITVIFGTLGDLIESMFKRCIEIKDTGHIMPGHGGLLDRLDSILFAIPVIFVYLYFTH